MTNYAKNAKYYARCANLASSSSISFQFKTFFRISPDNIFSRVPRLSLLNFFQKFTIFEQFLRVLRRWSKKGKRLRFHRRTPAMTFQHSAEY